MYTITIIIDVQMLPLKPVELPGLEWVLNIITELSKDRNTQLAIDVIQATLQSLYPGRR